MAISLSTAGNTRISVRGTPYLPSPATIAASTAAVAAATAAALSQTSATASATTSAANAAQTTADRAQTAIDRAAVAADASAADIDAAAAAASAATATSAASSLTTALASQYLVGAASSALSAERVVTDTASVTWDLTTPGQAKANATVAVAADSIGTTELTAAVEAMLVPPGAVVPFAMNTAPTGWLKANGAAVSRATYAALFTAIGTTFGVGDGSTTFNLPDMRGYFARGWVDDGSVGGARTFGSTQTDAMQGHRHTTDVPNGAGGSFSLDGAGAAGIATVTSSNPVTDTVNGTPRTANETRPSNVALLYCIKV